MANTALTRTPGSAGNRRTWTWSAWIKKSKIAHSSAGTLFGAKDGSYPEILYFASDDTLVWQHDIVGSDYLVTVTDRKFRDTNAWYHIVLAKDTTQSTEADRIKIYVNGEQQTLTESQLGIPGQNYEGAINNNVTHTIGNWESNSYYFDGSMSHIHFIDGTAYAASTFGSTDASTGEWKINATPSVTYGSNGFFILKDGNSVTDQSGNSNNFTVASGTLSKTEDCPSNVFATISPLYNLEGSYTLENGNTKFVPTGNNDGTFGTLAAIGGKFYFEVKYAAGSDTIYAGYAPVQLANNEGTSNPITSFIGQYRNTGLLQIGGSTDTAYTNVSDGDIFAFAIDLEASSGSRTVKAYKNGSLYGTVTIGTTYENDMWIPVAGDTSGGNAGRLEFNFGNGYFGTTAVSSAGTNASNNGIFEYDVPSGYTALSTKGLNL